ncbi:hypothetical protein EJ110_NYTH13287 [Nymphaea thermarum]|nr:hypothetical protein EJ110_NYTH13287 [Nymphaea thermarum]
MLRSFNDPIHALSLFKSLSQRPRIIHTTDTCNFMVDVIKRDLTTYITLLEDVGVFGGIKEAPLALDLMSEPRFVLNDFSYNGLIHMLLQSGCLQEAMKIYQQIISEMVRPNMKTYSALMVASGKQKHIENCNGSFERDGSCGVENPMCICTPLYQSAWKSWENSRSMDFE